MPTIAQTLLVFLPGFAWGVWLPYLSATIILIVGLNTLTKDFADRQGLDKFVALGPLFIAIPIAVFGTEHFTATKIIAGMVPGWIPGHMFWALFVGTCLIAAALSIAAGKYAWLAAALLGFMICLFVLLIHIPNIASAPHSRILWVVALRDFAFAGGAFSISAAQKDAWTPVARNRLVTLARLSLAHGDYGLWGGAISVSGTLVGDSPREVNTSLDSGAFALELLSRDSLRRCRHQHVDQQARTTGGNRGRARDFVSGNRHVCSTTGFEAIGHSRRPELSGGHFVVVWQPAGVR